MSRVTLYQKRGCDCCVKADVVLRENGIEPHIVMVEDTPWLAPTLIAQTPTVVIDGKIRFRGQVDPLLLNRILQSPSSQQRATTQIGIFAKHWTPGSVKTRLGHSIGMEPASRLAKTLIHHSLNRLARCADRQVVGYWPLDQTSAFAELAHADEGSRWELVQQSEGDLGQRMYSYFKEAAANGLGRIVLMGTDSPSVPVEHIQQAFDALRQSQVVLGPTEDGGYYLIGLQGDWVTAGQAEPLFTNMPWSTPQLWEATLQQLSSKGLHPGNGVALLPTWYDVDEIDDLQRLVGELATAGGVDPASSHLEQEIALAIKSSS